MKCFECGFRCVTKYHFGNKDSQNFERVTAVSKVCNMCGWESYPIKVPESLK